MTEDKKSAAESCSASEFIELKIHSLRERMERIGIGMSQVCRAAGVDKNTPSIWQRKIPKPPTVRTLDKLERAIEAAELEYRQQQQQAE